MTKKNIGILVIATGNYQRFVPPLYESLKKHFCTNHKVSLFLFTDKINNDLSFCTQLPIEHEPWPYITLKRFHVFSKYQDDLKEMDLLYYLDADMRLDNPVSNEIFPDTTTELVATEHPGFYEHRPEWLLSVLRKWKLDQWPLFGRKKTTFETNKKSTAYIPRKNRRTYFAGGFFGGTTEAFLKLSKTLKDNIDADLSKDIIAIWHDESHLNAYLSTHTPKILSPSYCYPESWDQPFIPRIIALDKDHKEVRDLN